MEPPYYNLNYQSRSHQHHNRSSNWARRSQPSHKGSSHGKGRRSGRLIRDGRPMGKGTYGTVYQAFYHRRQSDDGKGFGIESDRVAVKRNIVDAKASFVVPVRELTILNQLRGHPFLVKLLTISIGNPFIKVIKSRGHQRRNMTEPLSPIEDITLREDDLYFIFERASNDGHSLIYNRHLTSSIIKLSMVQILLGMEYVHSRGIIHRDLKPSNLLFFRNNSGLGTAVKICDFGLSKHATNQEPMTPRTVTSWYRAPEIVCRWKNYGSAIDCWSIGCIFYELVTRKALFYRMEDNRYKIFEKMRQTLPKHQVDSLIQVDRNHYYTRSTGNRGKWKSPSNWREILDLSSEKIRAFNGSGKGGSYQQFLHLLEGLLDPNPTTRLTATQALDHPFFDSYRDYIEATRTMHPPVSEKGPTIKILDREERQRAVEVAFNIYNRRSEYKRWYSHRILFQALDIFDRYLVWIDETQISSGYRTPKPRLANEEAEFRFMVCVYLAMKLFTTTRIGIGFRDMISEEYQSNHYLQLARSFESELITKALALHIYRESVYESADKLGLILSEIQVRDLLLAHGKVSSVSSTAEELLRRHLNLPGRDISSAIYSRSKGDSDTNSKTGAGPNKVISSTRDFGQKGPAQTKPAESTSGRVHRWKLVVQNPNPTEKSRVSGNSGRTYIGSTPLENETHRYNSYYLPPNKVEKEEPNTARQFSPPPSYQTEVKTDHGITYLSFQERSQRDNLVYPPNENRPDEIHPSKIPDYSKFVTTSEISSDQGTPSEQYISDHNQIVYLSRSGLTAQGNAANRSISSNSEYTPSTGRSIFLVGVQKISTGSNTITPRKIESLGLETASLTKRSNSGYRPRMIRLDEDGRRKIPLEQAGLLIKI